MPLQIGARGVAFPRLGATSFWLYLFGGVTLYASFLYRPPRPGVNPLPPLSDDVFSPTAGTDAWIVGVGLAVLGFVLHRGQHGGDAAQPCAPRAWPGGGCRSFSWAGAVTSYVLLFIGPVMLAAMAMLLIDRNFDGVFFDAGEGGSPILWQHLSWIFFTGAYVVMLLPWCGAISEILPVFARKPRVRPAAARRRLRSRSASSACSPGCRTCSRRRSRSASRSPGWPPRWR